MVVKSENKIVLLTAYSFSFAKMIDGLVDIILVGDSLGNVILGFDSTKFVRMEDMLRHTAAVKRGTTKSMIVADMPYQSEATQELALTNAQLLIEAGADAVKMEGNPSMIAHLTKQGIKVMGHIGFLPQTAVSTQVKGRTEEEATYIMNEAIAVEKAGAFAVVIEMVSAALSEKITQKLRIPTIGIGAGAACDGQVLVINDLLGLSDKRPYKFVKQYAQLHETIQHAVATYAEEVRKGSFPDEKHSFV